MKTRFVLLTLFSVAGCAHVTPQDRLDAAQEVTCSTKEDCELKWARATKWIQTNSYWKLRTVTDNVLTTEGPINSSHTAYEVTKFPKGDGVYEIQFRAGCAHGMFVCRPSTEKATASFKRYLMTGEMTAP